jgi:hypothetical protein
MRRAPNAAVDTSSTETYSPERGDVVLLPAIVRASICTPAIRSLLARP